MAETLKAMRRTVAGLCAVLVFSPAIARADAVLDWNRIMVTLVQDQPPPFQNRFAAITQLAVFEAVNAVTGDYQPYLGKVAPVPGASSDAAAVSAAYQVLRNYFPDRARPAVPRAELDRIAVPTTLIWGRHDLATPHLVAEAVSKRFGWPLHVIEDAADDPPIEQPETFLKSLDAALGSSPASKGASQ